MPTAYTSDVMKGEQTFEEYALKCARAFGTLVHMRDEPLNTKLRLRTEDTYYKESYEENKKEYEKLVSMNNDEILEYGNQIKDETEKTFQEGLNNIIKVEKNYNDMLAKIHAWNYFGPDYQPLKDFMISQLQESIQFDCSDGIKNSYIQMLKDLDNKKPRDFWEDKIKSVERNMNYFKEHMDNDVQHIDGNNAWILELHDLLNVDKDYLN